MSINRAKRIKAFFVILAVCGVGLAIPTLFCYALLEWFDATYDKPVRDFLAHEEEVEKHLAALNVDTFASLPPPPEGATLEYLSETNGSRSYYHGTSLFATYNVDRVTRMDSVDKYYRVQLEQKGWQSYGGSGETDIYLQETGCLKIIFASTPYAHEYDFYLWHDYLANQAFSTELPDLQYLQLLELGETEIDTCPPKWRL